jgi:hypothetical protein
MFILDFDRKPSAAFVHGFVKGLAAPVNLYHNEAAPAVPEVVPIASPRIGVRQAMERNWGRVGATFSSLIDELQKAEATKR